MTYRLVPYVNLPTADCSRLFSTKRLFTTLPFYAFFFILCATTYYGSGFHCIILCCVSNDGGFEFFVVSERFSGNYLVMIAGRLMKGETLSSVPSFSCFSAFWRWAFRCPITLVCNLFSMFRSIVTCCISSRQLLFDSPFDFVSPFTRGLFSHEIFDAGLHACITRMKKKLVLYFLTHVFFKLFISIYAYSSRSGKEKKLKAGFRRLF